MLYINLITHYTEKWIHLSKQSNKVFYLTFHISTVVCNSGLLSTSLLIQSRQICVVESHLFVLTSDSLGHMTSVKAKNSLSSGMAGAGFSIVCTEKKEGFTSITPTKLQS